MMSQQEGTEPNRFATQVGAHQVVASRRAVAFIKDYVDYPQNAFQAFGQVGLSRRIDDYPLLTDLPFRSDQALRDRGLGDEEGACNFYNAKPQAFLESARFDTRAHRR